MSQAPDDAALVVMNTAAPGTSTFGTGSFSPVSGAVASGLTAAPAGATNGLIGASDSSGALGGILDFVKQNPLLSYGVLTAGGQLISGMTSTLTPAQVTALNAQATANQAAANMTAFQQANLAGPKPVASNSPVTGTPQPLLTPTPGTINTAPTAPPVNVTGAPT